MNREAYDSLQNSRSDNIIETLLTMEGEPLDSFFAAEQWVGGLIGAIVAAMLSAAYRLCSKHFPRLLKSTSAGVRKFGRRRIRSRLLKIKAKRFDSLKITREIVKTYAYLTLFWLTASVWVIVILLGVIRPQQMIFAAPIILFFEIAWLTKSQFVDELLKSNYRIRTNFRKAERLLRLKKTRENELFTALVEQYGSNGFYELHFADNSTESGVVWHWRSEHGYPHQFSCVGGYDFNYLFDKTEGKKSPSFKSTTLTPPELPPFEREKPKATDKSVI
ncbi:hypothetical protein QYE80_13280 [Pseudomonas tohonis]|uniref:hypothetical protein n=1 Tax=Pseudomonas sp. zfem005 TaxID=3078200 RepID=UPI00146CB273|nr:hypothetical protein [Pseudomonas sp. zfem005]MDN4145962.1 hypothetical protein [Pseudomonas tohonis]MDU9415295.1 hypothetical protein [Pseudomonas sp. zfem005]